MTFKYKNVYVDSSATVVGPYEAKGPLGSLFDKSYNDLYFGESSFEKAEIKISKDSIKEVLKKSKKTIDDIDLFIAGDLMNQISTSTYAASSINKPFMGVYTACASNAEALTIGASLINAKYLKNVLCTVSSHNMSSEKQFRNPTEYGAPKPLTSTFTATGGASIILTNDKTDIKLESATVGEVVDMGQNNPLDMGAVMAGAAASTIKKHLEDTGRDANYYDLILTGDLGIYGKEILKDYLKEKYNIDISNNYDDCGVILYDTLLQKDVHAGGSGPVCSALVLYTKIFKMMKEKKLKRVLMVATGALFNPINVFQKSNIMSIANAVSLEAI